MLQKKKKKKKKKDLDIPILLISSPLGKIHRIDVSYYPSSTPLIYYLNVFLAIGEEWEFIWRRKRRTHVQIIKGPSRLEGAKVQIDKAGQKNIVVSLHNIPGILWVGCREKKFLYEFFYMPYF